MSVKSPLEIVLHCYFNTPTINKNLKFKLKEFKNNYNKKKLTLKIKIKIKSEDIMCCKSIYLHKLIF